MSELIKRRPNGRFFYVYFKKGVDEVLGMRKMRASSTGNSKTLAADEGVKNQV